MLVLEARSRLGGRTYTLDEPSLFVGLDAGAHWVHGGLDNVVTMSYVEHYGLPLIPVGGDSTYEGERVHLQVFDKLEQRWVTSDELAVTFDAFAMQMELAFKYHLPTNLTSAASPHNCSAYTH